MDLLIVQFKYNVNLGGATSNAEPDVGYVDMLGTGTLGRQAEFDRRKKRK